ncbi:MAG: lysylphosphatidylglycerol synthase transmembrane domain-containing protein [Candidatus Omnitrophota bacterium]
MKKLSSLILRISITGVLLIFLLVKTDVRSLANAFKTSDPLYLVLAFVLFVLLNGLGVMRWGLLLKGVGIQVNRGRLCLSYGTSLFFNLIFPSTLGGDTVRTLDIARYAKRHSSGVLATVMLDRLAGFFGLITVLIFAICLGAGILKDTSIAWGALVLVVLSVFLTGIMFSEPFFRMLFQWLPFKKIKDYCFQIHEAASVYKRQRTVLYQIWFLSVLIHLGICIVYYWVALAIGVRVPLMYFFLFVPAITVFSSIPVSIGGLGVRDASSVFLFSRIGLSASQAFVLSLANFAFLLVLGLSGGVAYVTCLYRRRL